MLSSVVPDGKDGLGVKLEKNAMPAKITTKMIITVKGLNPGVISKVG